jgi:hypothetical protein
MLNEALGKTGMAEGGVVPFDRTTFDAGNTSGVEVRKYIDPTTGVTQDFQFFLGEPSTPIPSNFVPWTQALADAAAVPKVPTTPTTPGGTGNTGGNDGLPGGGANERDYEPTGGGTGGGAGGGAGGFNYDNWAEKNYADITSNPYQFGIDALADDSGKLVSKGLGAVGILGGGPIAMVGSAGVKAVSKVQNIAEANAALQVMESKGLKGTTDYNNLQKTINIAVDALPDFQQILVEKEIAGSGNKYFGAIERKTGTPTPTPAPTQVGSGSGGGPTPKPTPGGGGGQGGPGNVGSGVQSIKTGGGSEKDQKSGGGGRSDTPVGGGMPAAEPTPGGVSGGGRGTVTKEVSTPSGTKTVSSTGYGQGGSKTENRRATGGLITKPQKTTPKTKGLAGKQ